MARIWIPMAVLCLQMIATAHAGDVSRIHVAEETPERVVIAIEGDYQAYQALGRSNPARLSIDLEEARLGKGVSKSMELENPVVSRIEAGDTDKGARVVVYSADPGRLFDLAFEEGRGTLAVICTLSRGAGKTSAVEEQPAPPEGLPASVAQGMSARSFPAGPAPGTGPQSEETSNRIVTYSGEKVTLDFFKTDIHNVFRLFAEISGRNIIVDERVGGELTLALKEVPWDLAMEIILEAKDLIKEEKENVFIIRPKPEKKEGGEGILVVRRFTDDAYDSAKRSKEDKLHRQQALDTLLEARETEKKGRVKEALALYEKAFLFWKEDPELMKENVDVIKRMAYLYFSIGNVAKSRYFATEALQLNPTDAESALYAALASVKLGKPGEARLFFDIATKNGRPLLPEAYYNYGLFLEDIEDRDGALYLFQRYEELFGPSARSSLAIARLREAQGKSAEACEKYREISRAGFSLDNQETDLVEQKLQSLCYQGG